MSATIVEPPSFHFCSVNITLFNVVVFDVFQFFCVINFCFYSVYFFFSKRCVLCYVQSENM